MFNIKSFLHGLKIEPKATGSLASDALGEFEVDSTTSELKFHDGTSRQTIATQAYVTASVSSATHADLQLSNLTGTTAVPINLLPDTQESRALGSAALAWSQIYSNSSQYYSGGALQGTVGTSGSFLAMDSNNLTIRISTSDEVTATKNININSGTTTGAVTSGQVLIQTGATAGGTSGRVYLKSGDPQFGATSGEILLEAGATSGTRGNITLNTDANQALLTAQPTGAVALAIATTDYVDNASHADLQLSNLTGTTAVPVHLLPDTTDVRNQGSATAVWATVFAGSMSSYVGGVDQGTIGASGGLLVMDSNNIALRISTSTEAAATQDVDIFTGAATGAAGTSGSLSLQSGDKSGGVSNSGAVTIESGAQTDVTGGDTGVVNLLSGASTTIGNSGNINIMSGNAGSTTGTSGGITLQTGTGGTARNIITLNGGVDGTRLADHPTGTIPLAIATVDYADNAGGSTSFEVTETGHGFTVGQGIYFNSTNWVLGQADASTTLAYYVVTEVVDVNTLILTDFGRITATAHGFTVDSYYFLSEVTPGLATSTEPSTGFSNPLFYVEDANTLQLKVYRPNAIDGGIDLDNINDVSAAAPGDGQVLTWDNGNSRYEVKSGLVSIDGVGSVTAPFGTRIETATFASAVAQTDSVKSVSGAITGNITNRSGNNSVQTGDTNSTNAASDSGGVLLITGGANAGDSGAITLQTGSSTSGARGNIILNTAADGSVLIAQPTGDVPLSIATTKYVDDNAGGDADTIHLIRSANAPAVDWTISSDTDVPDYAGADVLSAAFTVPTSGSNALLSNLDAHNVYSLVGAAGSQYDGQGIVLGIDKRARGADVLVSMDYRTFKTTGDSSNGDYQLHIYDKTNATLLTDSLTLFNANDSDTTKEGLSFKKYVQIPATCAEIVVFVQQRTADTDTSIFFDNVLVSADPFQKVETQSKTVYSSATSTDVTVTAETKVDLIVNDDPDNMVNTTLDRYEITTEGVYTLRFGGSVLSGATNWATLSYALNGGAKVTVGILTPSASAGTTNFPSVDIRLSDGDYVELYTQSGTTSAISLVSSSLKLVPTNGTAIIVDSLENPGSEWTSFTPVGTFTTNTTYTGYWKRIGDTVHYDIKMAFAGAPNTSSSITIDNPAGIVLDTSKTVDSNVRSIYGIGRVYDDIGNSYEVSVGGHNTNAVFLKWHNSGLLTNVSQASPITLGAGDSINAKFSFPVVGWSNEYKPLLAIPTITVGQNSETAFVSHDTANFFNATGVVESNFNSALVSNNDNLLFDIADVTTITRITAKARIQMTVEVSCLSNGAGTLAVKQSDGSKLSNVSGPTTGYGVIAVGTKILEAGDYMYVEGSSLSARTGGITIIARAEEGQRNQAAIISQPVAIIEDRKTATTNGGTSSITSVARDLNTLSGDVSAVGVSLDGTDGFKFAATGEYLIEWSAPAYESDRHSTALRNETLALNYVMGTAEFSGSTQGTVTRSMGVWQGVIQKDHVIAINHEVQTSNATDGWGLEMGSIIGHTAYEVYTQVKITRKS